MSGPHVVIVGGGTMGLASASVLARRGASVTVLERFDPIHELGSHGGYTRIIRQAYHEGSGYVPLVREAEAAWHELSLQAGEPLLVRCGLLEFGPPDDPELRAAIDVCDACDVEHEIVTADVARKRWPIALPSDFIACLSPSGGYLRVVPCMRAMLSAARGAGAIVHSHARVVAIDGTAVVLADGERILADRIVVSAGAWLSDLVPSLLPDRVVVMRRVLGWTAPETAERAALARMPVWGAFTQHGFFYGFPYNDEGVEGFKVACHRSASEDFLDRPIDPESVDRQPDAKNLAMLEAFLAEHIPRARGPWVATRVCMYTVTPSWDFVVDRVPEDPRIVVAGGFSGHGFKFAPAIGRLVADLVLGDDAPPPDFAVTRHRQRPAFADTR